MASGLCSGWFHLWIIILSTDISADSTTAPHYTIHRLRVTFEEALENCSPGVPTSLATEQEVSEVLKLISNLETPQSNFTFWVGLKKAKDKCVILTQPLRGFKWVEDSSEKSQVIHWAQEPQYTCTSVRCAVLTGELDGATVIRWGLIPVSCKNRYHVICKVRRTSEDRGTTVKSATAQPTKPVTAQPEAVTPKLLTQPEPQSDLNSTTGPEQVRLHPGPSSGQTMASDFCQHPVVPESRSLRLDPNNSSRIQVECWSSDQLELHCRGHPAMWYLHNNSPANLSTICQPCQAGFQKDASGNCVDIDKCSNRSDAPCKHTCLNGEGSDACCSDDGSAMCIDLGKVGDGGLLSGILTPVLLAVAALVVLVVVVAVVVAVKCCLMRRKKRAMKRKEKMAMKNKGSRDSFCTANEKAAT